LTAPPASGVPEPPGLEPPPVSSSVAMLQEYVWNQGNAWQVTIEELGRYFERVAPVPLPTDATAAAAEAWAHGQGEEPPASVTEAVRAYIATAEILGRRTGELHVTLADGRDDPAFAPEPMTKEDLKTTVQVMRRQAELHLNVLEAVLPRLDGRAHDEARRVLEERDALLQQFDELHGITAASLRIRCHGDYHLGQILVTEGDVMILDFEGEPARPLAERREKSSPLRDVAGMLRSFSYAAMTAITAGTETRPEDAKRLTPWAELWEQWVSATFLRAYLAATRDAAFLPPAPDRDVLLRAFMLDKALYEMAYELTSRPTWVHVPLAGVLQLRARTTA
jgi:maltose alpha-D-glucosyltransferase/alpha-amylase